MTHYTSSYCTLRFRTVLLALVAGVFGGAGWLMIHVSLFFILWAPCFTGIFVYALYSLLYPWQSSLELTAERLRWWRDPPPRLGWLDQESTCEVPLADIAAAAISHVGELAQVELILKSGATVLVPAALAYGKEAQVLLRALMALKPELAAHQTKVTA